LLHSFREEEEEEEEIYQHAEHQNISDAYRGFPGTRLRMVERKPPEI
jgi:hypothetical protein